jgi:hypothetical protein
MGPGGVGGEIREGTKGDRYDQSMLNKCMSVVMIMLFCIILIH